MRWSDTRGWYRETPVYTPLVMSFDDSLQRVHRHDLSRFRPFVIAGERLGWVRHDFARGLAEHADVFEVSDQRVLLRDDLADFAARTEAVARVLRERGDVSLTGEDFPVVRAWDEEPLLKMDRGAVNRFGVKAFGIHLNGFVRTDAGLELWVAKRSEHVRNDPGKLDHLMAGGQPYGLSLEENLVKECAEEASIPAALARRAVPTGSVSYRMETDAGLRDDTLFTYDLELPPGFEPVASDGEVAWFQRWPVERVVAKVRDEGEAFKFNVPPVLIDFFARHGLLPRR